MKSNPVFKLEIGDLDFFQIWIQFADQNQTQNIFSLTNILIMAFRSNSFNQKASVVDICVAWYLHNHQRAFAICLVLDRVWDWLKIQYFVLEYPIKRADTRSASILKLLQQLGLDLVGWNSKGWVGFSNIHLQRRRQRNLKKISGLDLLGLMIFKFTCNRP